MIRDDLHTEIINTFDIHLFFQILDTAFFLVTDSLFNSTLANELLSSIK